MGIIYELINQDNGKKYIGQTQNNLNFRFNQHKNNSYTRNTPLYSSMRKHGVDKFKIYMVEICPNHILNEKESFYIKNKNTLYPYGYNLLENNKISNYSTRFIKNNNLSDTHKINISIGRKNSLRAKISSRMNGKKFIGQRFPLDHGLIKYNKLRRNKKAIEFYGEDKYHKLIEKRSKSLKNNINIVENGEKQWAHKRKSYQFFNPNGELISFHGLHLFCKTNNLDPSCMSKLNIGKLKSYKGWKKLK
jgi:group I intron endonuclease